MALRIAPASILPVVGTTENAAGKTLVFCNGIMNDFENAKNGALQISRAFGDKKVFVFHNPTTLGDYFDPSLEQTADQINLGACLARKINEFIVQHREKNIPDEQICITLFVHSHGAVVTEKALAGVIAFEQKHKDKISVYSFGGATVIPKQLASNVHNYFIHEDLVADFGNLRGRKEMILYQVKQIDKLMQEKNMTCERAILEQSYKDLFMELHPLNRIGSRRIEADKAQRYQAIFINKSVEALIADPYFLERIEEYQACFQNYNITLLEGVPFQDSEYKEIKTHSNVPEFLGNLPGNLLTGVRNASVALFALGSHAAANHQLLAYQSTIEKIAEEEQQ
jgi:hypothetical protein